MRRLAFALVLVALTAGRAPAQTAPDSAALQRSVQELTESIGRWDVETRFLAADGSVARSVRGTYTFAWAVPGRVVSGVSEQPELNQRAAILFYVSEAAAEIIMLSVGRDGALWTMRGPLGGNVRTSQPYDAGGGRMARLRFTRSNVTPDSFESRMEFSSDDGQSWVPANHQFFRRLRG